MGDHSVRPQDTIKSLTFLFCIVTALQSVLDLKIPQETTFRLRWYFLIGLNGRKCHLLDLDWYFPHPPIPQDASLTESGIGIVPTPLYPRMLFRPDFFPTLSQYFTLPWGSKINLIA